MKWRQRISRLGLIWLGVAFVLAGIGAVLGLLNFDSHNVYRHIGIYLELAGMVMMGATGVVNQIQIGRGRSLADRRQFAGSVGRRKTR
ncbi:hypothetical protein M6D93_04445 [Jatrophihabitans telluris]|uniref:Uncharacterized protein n=1 Tax=Jatrophihabitans telluris TaxID=2038343 RepID=A0ABY4R1V1_9ACTN|nr:hypothetical protein [Jatrophihabitans telluris]UQX89256.1 hypothetical protein M6D93_04445 [Jatrophihabitans telluris]